MGVAGYACHGENNYTVEWVAGPPVKIEAPFRLGLSLWERLMRRNPSCMKFRVAR